MSAATHYVSLLDVDPYTMKQVDDLASILMKRYESDGWSGLTQTERKQLRLMRTLLDGFAEPKSG